MGIADQVRRAMDAMGGKSGDKGGDRDRRRKGMDRKGMDRDQGRDRGGGGRSDTAERAKDAAREAMERAKKYRKDQGR